MRFCKPGEVRTIRRLLIRRDGAKTHIGPLDEVFWARVRDAGKQGKDVVVSPRLSRFSLGLF
jgi:hypothetical protein